MNQISRSPADLRDMFGANLRRLSKRYSSISELSRQLGINRTQFNRYLSGESFPRPDVLDRICRFFGVDARILLEPVESLTTNNHVISGPFLSDFLANGTRNIPEEFFPSGFYCFYRRSFLNTSLFLRGLVHVSRSDQITHVRGFEAREAMRSQGLSEDLPSREFRGYVARTEDGVTMMISRRHALSSTFNYLSRISSFENNFWSGYVSRSMRESPGGIRVTRMIYEYLGTGCAKALPTARNCGFIQESDLLPFHRRLLQPDEPFA